MSRVFYKRMGLIRRQKMFVISKCIWQWISWRLHSKRNYSPQGLLLARPCGNEKKKRTID